MPYRSINTTVAVIKMFHHEGQTLYANCHVQKIIFLINLLKHGVL